MSKSKIKRKKQNINQVDQVAQAKTLAEGIVGTVHWTTDTLGHCTCPDEHLHKAKSASQDCSIKLDGMPKISCFHQDCRDPVADTTEQLRTALKDAGIRFDAQDYKKSKDDKARIEAIRKMERLHKRTVALQGRVFKIHRWPYADIIKAAPVPANGKPSEHWKLLLKLFKPGDIVWIGEKDDSGKAQHAKHFKRAQDWLNEKKPFGPFICPSAFKPGSVSRCNDCVSVRRFLVVGADTIDRDQLGAVFRWLRDKVKLPLHAIVEAADKSMQGWFEFPGAAHADELRTILPALGCQVDFFRPSQPCNLPGFPDAEGRPTRLVYLGEMK